MSTETTPPPPRDQPGFNPLWLVLGLAVVVLLPFGPMPLLAAGVAGMFLFQQLGQIPGLLAVGLLFLLAGPEPLGARMWLAFRWGAGTVLAAVVPAILVVLAWGEALDAHRFFLMQATLWLDAAWLPLAALLAWRRPAGETWPKALLVACLATSRLMMFPLLLAVVLTSGDAMQVVMLPVFGAGLCLGMLMLLGLCGLAARVLQTSGERAPPRRILAALALLALVVQLIRLVAGMRAGL
ncbi:hypothetical protein BKE38_02610 [Pseudoroseomonas deserti]|uniref:Uncharacterized protein n=1 Tax=Teichococcus deserti TaxID=1817963 RepID=A0A1V2H7V2_9PROT|nr:hypothetical protein [Pseudoroseomonas deserti]ONG58688.1 hypothetical protein BKE38_02610 [Pseudoroseomonas deserti]